MSESPEYAVTRLIPDRPYSLAVGVVLLVSGVLVLLLTAILEGVSGASPEWQHAVFSPEGSPPWDDAYPIHVRRVPLRHFPWQESLVEKLHDSGAAGDIEAMGLDMTEWVLSLELAPSETERLLADGRLPVPGEPEVIAGVFTRLEEFELAGTMFRVVGHLRPSVGGVYFAYLLPRHPRWRASFEEDAEATAGWLHPDGLAKIVELENPEAFVADEGVVGVRVPAQEAGTYAVLLGLMLVAVGGAMMHLALFRVLARRKGGLLSPILLSVSSYPRLVVGLHAFLYGGFFVMMIVSLQFPVGSMFVQKYVAHAFSEGDLSYIGEAYESGNVLRAALATFLNNYILQTVGLTVLISLVLPMIGVLKTLASFMLVGFGMAPLWQGMAGTYAFHSITMTLEFEGYIFACVGVCVFWMRIGAGMLRGELRTEAIEAFKVVGSATMLSGIMLAVAGLYEAATLILLR